MKIGPVVSAENRLTGGNCAAISSLTAVMIRLHLVQIWWVSDQYIQSSRDSTVYNRRQSALGLVYLRSLGGSTVMFRYYPLGGDTVAPSGLYATLCHTFLVFIITRQVSPLLSWHCWHRRFLCEFAPFNMVISKVTNSLPLIFWKLLHGRPIYFQTLWQWLKVFDGDVLKSLPKLIGYHSNVP